MGQTRITAYLAPEGFVKQVVAELKGVQAVHGRLVIAEGRSQTSHWSQNTWLEPRILQIRSIADGAKALRAIQRNWAVYSIRSATRPQRSVAVALPLTIPARSAIW